MSQLPVIGDVVAAKYSIESLLGQGGMGAVYVARHRITGKRLALKVLLPGVAEDTGAERFLREAQSAGSIHHRNVVDVYDIGHDGGRLYMVMELLEGKTLSELLSDESMTLQQALLVLSRTMDGVQAAHDVGVVHRDLKPDNIFVCYGSSGELDDPRVLDFGISKASGADARLTQTGAMLGTPYYMSFEQINAQTDLDARVDVYAMGVILYEAMAGQRPYESDVLSALALRISEGKPVPLHQLRPDVPQALCDVVMKAMARERDDRYPTIAVLAQAVEPFIPRTADLSIPADQALPLRTPPASARMRQVTPRPASGSLVASGTRRRAAWWLVPVLAAVGVGAWWWTRPQLPPAPAQGSAVVASEESAQPEAAHPLEPKTGQEPASVAAAVEPSSEAPEQWEVDDAAMDAAGQPAEVGTSQRPTEPTRRETKHRDAKRRKSRVRAPEEARVPVPAPASRPVTKEPAPSPTKAPTQAEPVEAEGRAGRLGMDDF